MSKEEYEQVKQLVQKAIQLKQENQFREARNILEQGLEQYPLNNYLKTSLADVYFRLNQLERAEQMAREVLKQKPGEPRALIVQGNIAYSRRDYEQALERFEEALINKKHPYLASRIINTLVKLGRLTEARDFCQQWMDKQPDEPRFKKLMGIIYEKMNQTGQALDYFEDYLEENPDDEFVYKEKIKLKIKDKPPAAAARELKSLLKVGDRRQNLQLQLLLAKQLEKAGNYREAAGEYKQALEQQPDHQYARKQAGFCFYKQQQYRQALPYLKEAFRQDPSDYFVRSTLISIFKELGQIEEGITFFKEIIRNNPGFENLWGIIKKLQKEAGENNAQD